MKNNRIAFTAQCPYCKERSNWLFAITDIGNRDTLVDCEHCGKTYMIEIALAGVVNKTYALVEQ